MTVPRALLIMFMMIAIGIAIAVLRGESAKAANRIQALHQQKIELEQKLWTMELDLARLRGPEAIRRRTLELGLDVLPPSEASGDLGGAGG